MVATAVRRRWSRCNRPSCVGTGLPFFCEFTYLHHPFPPFLAATIPLLATSSNTLPGVGRGLISFYGVWGGRRGGWHWLWASLGGIAWPPRARVIPSCSLSRGRRSGWIYSLCLGQGVFVLSLPDVGPPHVSIRLMALVNNCNSALHTRACPPASCLLCVSVLFLSLCAPLLLGLCASGRSLFTRRPTTYTTRPSLGRVVENGVTVGMLGALHRGDRV